MMIPGGATVAGPAGLVRTFQPQSFSGAGAAVGAQREDFARRFDSVTITEGSSAARDLKSRLSQEVRTATSTDMVSALRQQIRSGTYQSDPREIARKMLLMGEAV